MNTPIETIKSDVENKFSMNSENRKGLYLLVILFVVIFVWGWFAQISGAVIASGRIAFELNLKKIQHREGGIVRDILVREGDRVSVGQVLLRLDPTVADATDSAVKGQLWQLMARKMRIEAELSNSRPSSINAGTLSTPEFDKIIFSERELMTARLRLRSQQKEQLRDQIRQGEFEIVGNEAQIKSLLNQTVLIKQELVGVKDLYEKGYAPFTRLSQLEREAERLEGQVGELKAGVARIKARISQIREAIFQIDSQAISENLTELKDTQTKLTQLQEQYAVTRDTLQRIELKAPVSGKVQQLSVHTNGGVVGAGENLMLIVPDTEELIIEAMIDPSKVDSVSIGSKAYIRFTAFSTTTTPEAIGRVDHLSSDVETDEKSGFSYYRVRLKLAGIDVPKKIKNKIVSGMPVEVQIETKSRNALSYFIKPLADQFNRTFREE